MVAVAPDDPAKALSGGMYVPLSRNDLMLDMRRRDEAEGERRMIGSGRRDGFLGRETRDELPAATDAGIAGVEDGWLGRGRLRPRKTSADFRTCENCYVRRKLIVWRKWENCRSTDCRFDSPEDTVSISHSSLAVVDLL